jgi:hypothetical protein
MPFPETDGEPIETGPEDVPPDPTDGAVGPFGNPMIDPAPTNERQSGRTCVQTQCFIESMQ